MREQAARRLHRIDKDTALRLVDAGLDTPARIRAATDAELRQIFKGKGATDAVRTVRAAYRKK
jgi:hypothetical protein